MDTLPDTDRLGIGGNNPPDPIALLQEKLQETHTDLIDRAGQLAGMADRLPDACEDVDTAQRLADAIKSCAAFQKNSEAARVAAKEPYLAAERAVDGWFKKVAEPVNKVKATMTTLLTTYQRKVEAEERRKREEAAAEAERIRKEEERARRAAEAAAREAQRKAQEAERLAAEAKDKAAKDAAAKAAAEAAAAAAKAAEQTAAAAAAQVEAQATREAAAEKPAELTRTRTDLGAVASLRRTWGYEVVNIEDVPRMFLVVDDAAVKAFIKARTDKKTGDCSAKIPGIKLVEQFGSRVA